MKKVVSIRQEKIDNGESLSAITTLDEASQLEIYEAISRAE